MVFGMVVRVAEIELEKSELSQCLHERRGSQAPHLTGPRSDSVAVEKRWPRSKQYSSHLFNIMLRAQR